MANAPRVTMIGGGMITRIQLLPSIYQLQREGIVGEIHICDSRARPLIELQESGILKSAFPDCTFTPHPDPAGVEPGPK